MDAMTIMASQGHLDDKTLLQLSVSNAKIVTRPLRHNALKHRMRFKLQLQENCIAAQDRAIVSHIRASLQALSAIMLSRTHGQAVNTAIRLMDFVAERRLTAREAVVFKAEYDEQTRRTTYEL